ncbi:acyltransferase family protein [Marinobacter lutaoensis]|uniref:acyltransferase family protein n=1 Tax=Marinobacter lutaoensis TaxID=135739 RepID=UPI0015942F70|nr:acyltransferase family protein [Marinobacter lutaoensis]NVD37169.1 acyltransferase [Marinobacter lutaoensis]
MQYRREIDGLRALAVLPVIFFHAGFSWFSGGYVGVDVFFVISGYLITSILLSDLEKGEFSISKFYERRARRILPALFFVMLCCIPFAWAWMAPEQLKEFAQAFVAISFFASNILFWKKEDYFAPNAEENPLLHTWSLAVEEQFYLFFPILLLLLWRFGKSPIFYLIVMLSVVSLAFSEWASRYYASANFYLLPTRAWELGVGAICAFFLSQRSLRESQAFSLLGVVLIVASIFLFDETTRFPSLYALAPVIGAALIILFGSKKTFAGKILSNSVLVGIGLISFSAYLWHQPLLAFARIRILGEPTLSVMFLLSIASLLLAWFSWKYIEQPFRKSKGGVLPSRRAVFSASALMTLALFSFGIYGHTSGGVPKRISLPDSIAKDLHVRELQKECFDFSMQRVEDEGLFCILGEKSKPPTVAVIGDSHSLSFIPALDKLARDKSRSFLFSGVSGCPPTNNTYVYRTDERRDVCAKRNQLAHKKVVERGIQEVILISRWTYYSTGDVSSGFVFIDDEYDVEKDRTKSMEKLSERLTKTLKEYEESGVSVTIFHQPPVQEIDARSFYNYAFVFGKSNFDKLLLEMSVKTSDHMSRYRPVYDLIENASKEFGSVSTVDFTSDLCGSEICEIGNSERSNYFDDNHLSNFGAAKLLSIYADKLFKN